jgi:hypothetical protein
VAPGTVPDCALVGGQADRLQPQHGVQVGQVLRPQLRLQAMLCQGPLIQALSSTRKNNLVKFQKITFTEKTDKSLGDYRSLFLASLLLRLFFIKGKFLII